MNFIRQKIKKTYLTLNGEHRKKTHYTPVNKTLVRRKNCLLLPFHVDAI